MKSCHIFFVWLSLISAALSSQPKVLILFTPAESVMMNQLDIGNYLSRNDYNVSLLFPEGSKFISKAQQNPALTIVEFEGVTQQKLDHALVGEFPDDPILGQREFYLLPLRDLEKKQSFISRLQGENYDLCLVSDVVYFAHLFGCQRVIAIMVGPLDYVMQRGLMGGDIHSTNKLYAKSQLYGFSEITDYNHPAEALDYVPRTWNLLYQYYEEEIKQKAFQKQAKAAVGSKYRYIFDDPRHADLLIVKGAEGIPAPYNAPPNTKYVYPLIKEENKNIPLNPEVKMFLDKHQKTFYLSFGTYFGPTKDQLETYIEFAQKHSEYGILLSTHKVYLDEALEKKIKGTGNILYQEWVQQKEVLAHPNVKIFLTHGGYNSLTESCEAGVPLLVVPAYPFDSVVICEDVQENQLGYCLPFPTYASFKEKIALFEKNNFFQGKMSQVSKAFAKKREENDLLYWLKYSLVVGTNHLQPRVFQGMNFWQAHELDTHIIVYLMIFLPILTCEQIIKRILINTFCPYEKEEKKKKKE